MARLAALQVLQAVPADQLPRLVLLVLKFGGKGE